MRRARPLRRHRRWWPRGRSRPASGAREWVAAEPEHTADPSVNPGVADSHDGQHVGASARGLCDFIDASPSPFHVCATVARRLLDAGYIDSAKPTAGRTSRAATSPSGPARWSLGRVVARKPHSGSSARTPTAQPAGQAAAGPAGRRLAGGGAGAVRGRVAELLAGP